MFGSSFIFYFLNLHLPILKNLIIVENNDFMIKKIQQCFCWMGKKAEKRKMHFR